MPRKTNQADAHTTARSSRRATWWILSVGLVASLLLGTGMGVLQANAAYLALPLPPLALALTGAALMGLLLGLANRLLLQHWAWPGRLFLAMLAVPIWLATTELSLVIWTRTHPLAHLAQIDPWIKAGQLGLGWLSLIAISLLGRRPHKAAPVQWTQKLGHRASTAGKAPLHWSLLLHLGTALLLGVGMGVLQANTGHMRVPVPPLAIALIGAAIAGLVAGAMAVLTLRGWTEAVKVLVALLALLAWLAAAEITYAEWRGLRPFPYLSGADNWIEMGQLAIGGLGSIVGGLGRRRTLQVPPLPRQPETAVPARPSRRKQRPSTARPRPSRARQTAREPRHWSIPLPRIRLPLPRTGFPRPRARAPKQQPLQNGATIRVTGVAEDRCPYCLDVIEKNDPRGVVVCEVCGTPHHADCWEAAGGKCQVPHLNI